jgi:hypothetical protein
MADNVAITAGSGTTVAADDIGGALHQRVKVTWGPDGTGNDTDVASGKPMPVQLRSSTGTAITPITPDVGAGTGGSATQRVIVDSAQLAALATTAQAMSAGFQGVDVPTDGTGAQRPVAIAHGTNPTAVAAAVKTPWYANRAGVPFVVGGHPNVITRSHVIADSDGAQTDAALLTVSAGAKIVVTQISCKADAANTTNVAVKIGFGATTIPAASLSGTAAILLEGQFSANNGHQVGNGAGIIGIGADGEDLRITCGDPVSGNLRVTYSYYTIES